MTRARRRLVGLLLASIGANYLPMVINTLTPIRSGKAEQQVAVELRLAQWSTG